MAKPKKKIAKAPKRAKAKETAEEKVDTATGPQLLLGNLPPVKDLIYHLESIAGWQAKAKTAQGKVSDAKKKAKEAGVDVTAITRMMGYERMDPLDLATELRQLQAMMVERGLPVQMNLYEPKYGSIEEQAKAEGYKQGYAQRAPDSARWPEGAPGHSEYSRAWNDGTRQANEDNLAGKNNEGEEED